MGEMGNTNILIINGILMEIVKDKWRAETSKIKGNGKMKVGTIRKSKKWIQINERKGEMIPKERFKLK